MLKIFGQQFYEFRVIWRRKHVEYSHYLDMKTRNNLKQYYTYEEWFHVEHTFASREAHYEL